MLTELGIFTRGDLIKKKANRKDCVQFLIQNNKLNAPRIRRVTPRGKRHGLTNSMNPGFKEVSMSNINLV